MYLSKITVKNLYLLYLLKDVSTKLEKDITLMIRRNNNRNYPYEVWSI